MTLSQEVWRLLQETSRTFFLPIRRLPPGLQESIAAAYLSMRAIDEIEDHPHLGIAEKVKLLTQISQRLQAQPSGTSFPPDTFATCCPPLWNEAPEVTRRLADWLCLPPEAIAPRIWEATATMAERMAGWAESNWSIQTENDLDRYTYAVAGATGVLLCDLWAWAGGEQLNRSAAIGFGRALQAVNILRNRSEDVERGVDFFPVGWTSEQMQQYAWRHLLQAEAYARTLPSAPFEALIQLPLVLATATLDALEKGKSKLSRQEVLSIVGQLPTEGGHRGFLHPIEKGERL